MSRFKRSVLWAALLAIVLLVVFSVYGAFIGVDQAKAFFNSLPLAVYWWLLVILLATGIILFQQLIRVPSLLLMHLGCIVVLMGGMWGSAPGHILQYQIICAGLVQRLMDNHDIGMMDLAHCPRFAIEFFLLDAVFLGA